MTDRASAVQSDLRSRGSAFVTRRPTAVPVGAASHRAPMVSASAAPASGYRTGRRARRQAGAAAASRPAHSRRTAPAIAAAIRRRWRRGSGARSTRIRGRASPNPAAEGARDSRIDATAAAPKARVSHGRTHGATRHARHARSTRSLISCRTRATASRPRARAHARRRQPRLKISHPMPRQRCVRAVLAASKSPSVRAASASRTRERPGSPRRCSSVTA